jgi:hypothetical protein
VHTREYPFLAAREIGVLTGAGPRPWPRTTSCDRTPSTVRQNTAAGWSTYPLLPAYRQPSAAARDRGAVTSWSELSQAGTGRLTNNMVLSAGPVSTVGSQ